MVKSYLLYLIYLRNAIAVTKLDKLQERVANKSDSWSDVQAQLTQLVDTLKNYTEQVNQGIQTLGDRFVESISNQTENNQSHLQAIDENLQQCINSLLDTNYENRWMTQLIEHQIDPDKSSIKSTDLFNELTR